MIIWSAVELEDFEDLINLGITHEEWSLLNQFSEDAADGPHVDSQRVLFLAKKNFWSSVPESLDFVCQSFDGNREGSGQTEITDLEVPLFVHQNILGLQVTMEDSVCMHIIHSR